MNSIFLKLSDPLLRKVAEGVRHGQINSAETKKIIKTMLKIAYGKQKDENKPIMVGLAAPQIGISKRIILVDIAANGKGKVGNLRIYINPKIIWKSKEKGEWYEGCFSTGRVCGIVSRPLSIKIQAKVVEEKYTGYIARIFQHEIDHLDGKLFIDHIKDPGKLHWVEEHEFPLYRNKEAWRNWPKKWQKNKE